MLIFSHLPIGWSCVETGCCPLGRVGSAIAVLAGTVLQSGISVIFAISCATRLIIQTWGPIFKKALENA